MRTMELFSKTFFRLAFGFVAIIAISIAVIALGSVMREEPLASDTCLNCASN